MSKQETNRVLNRMGARAVTKEELGQVAAAGGPPVHTEACTVKIHPSGGSVTCDVEH